MVQLVEVEDEHFVASQAVPDDDDDYSDTDSDISTESDYDSTTETLTDRLTALRDIIPPALRSRITSHVTATYDTLLTSTSYAARGLWALSSSVIFLGVPFALCWMEEQQVLAMEQEFKMREQGDELLKGGEGEGGLEGRVKEQLGAALTKPAI